MFPQARRTALPRRVKGRRVMTGLEIPPNRREAPLPPRDDQGGLCQAADATLRPGSSRASPPQDVDRSRAPLKRPLALSTVARVKLGRPGQESEAGPPFPEAFYTPKPALATSLTPHMSTARSTPPS